MTEEEIREIVKDELAKFLKVKPVEIHEINHLDREAAWQRAHIACKQAFSIDDDIERIKVAKKLIADLREKEQQQ